ncbi:MAG: acyl-CoA dehydrogenase family protein, partial [Candidatus Thorarchaeota archaeon]
MRDYLSEALWTEDEINFRKEVRAFCDKEIYPIADEIDKNPYPRELLRKIGKTGISAANAGLDMARMASTTLYGMPVARFGTPEQKKKYLEPVVHGEKIGCIGITEPDVGSDTAGMKTQAEKDGDEWIINGEKRFITNGSQSDYMCAFAISDPEVKSKAGMSAFIVDTKSDGFSVVKDHELLGMKSARVSWLKMDNVR